MGLHLELNLLNKWKCLICHTDHIGACHSPLRADGGHCVPHDVEGTKSFYPAERRTWIICSAESHHDKQQKNELLFENYCDL